ncbi:hypothetical protein ACIGO6_15125 [Streptomyces sp. NPDC053750]|uniref:hypothetical protein n=1 Tax=Streptomyces sp. NPDC053750 TaxID=3365714 RepID=UPI0037D0ECD1
MPLHAGKRPATRPRRAEPRRGTPARRRARPYGLAGIVVCAVALPFAVASAGLPGAGGRGPEAVHLLPGDGDAKVPEGARRAPAAVTPVRSPLPVGPATAVRCGPELSSPQGIEAQTCVLTQGTESWARTSYRNATGHPLEAVLSLTGPDGRSVRMRCAVSAEDAPDTCETPRERTRGEPLAYTAVAEFAGQAGSGPLLLRTGSGRAGRSDGGYGSAEGDGSGGLRGRNRGGTESNSTVETRS